MHPTEQSTKPTQSRHLVITRHGHLPDTAERGDYHPPGCVHLGPGLSVEAVQPSPWPSGQCPASPLPESVRRTQNTELPTCWQKDVHSAAPSVRRTWEEGGGGDKLSVMGEQVSSKPRAHTHWAQSGGGAGGGPTSVTAGVCARQICSRAQLRPDGLGDTARLCVVSIGSILPIAQPWHSLQLSSSFSSGLSCFVERTTDVGLWV